MYFNTHVCTSILWHNSNFSKSQLTLLNQIVKPTISIYGSDQNQINQLIGNMVVAMFIIGFIGSILVGAVLDRTKKFKLITLINTVTFCVFYVWIANRLNHLTTI